LHLEHCSSGGASALRHSALPHASLALPAAGVAAAAAFLDISLLFPSNIVTRASWWEKLSRGKTY